MAVSVSRESSRKVMKNSWVSVRLLRSGSGEIGEPLGPSRPFNGLIRRVPRRANFAQPSCARETPPQSSRQRSPTKACAELK